MCLYVFVCVCAKMCAFSFFSHMLLLLEYYPTLQLHYRRIPATITSSNFSVQKDTLETHYLAWNTLKNTYYSCRWVYSIYNIYVKRYLWHNQIFCEHYVFIIPPNFILMSHVVIYLWVPYSIRNLAPTYLYKYHHKYDKYSNLRTHTHRHT